jgi:hypothetical protein
MEILRKSKLALTICAGALMLISGKCENKKDGENKHKSTTDNKTEVAAEIPKVKVEAGFMAPKENDPFKVSHLDIKDSILTMVVSYSGGCKDHEFEMWAGKNYMKSMPPQLNLFLKHEANDDLCKAMKFDTLRFDVSPVKYQNQNAVILRFNNTKHVAKYEY